MSSYYLVVQKLCFEAFFLRSSGKTKDPYIFRLVRLLRTFYPPVMKIGTHLYRANKKNIKLWGAPKLVCCIAK